MTQFPSPAAAHVGKFVAFIAGSFAALLLALALVEDTLLERHLFGRTLVSFELALELGLSQGQVWGRCWRLRWWSWSAACLRTLRWVSDLGFWLTRCFAAHALVTDACLIC